MTPASEITQVSGVRVYHALSVHCIVCSSPQVTSPSITTYPPFTLSPTGNHQTAICVHEFFKLLMAQRTATNEKTWTWRTDLESDSDKSDSQREEVSETH